jgi:SAM-dependent methyltransferase
MTRCAGCKQSAQFPTVPMREQLETERRHGAGFVGSDGAMDLPRHFVIRESTHRIHETLTPSKLARLGEALLLRPRQRVLDLACGSGEMLCTWARDHGITGVGVDENSAFIDDSRTRSAALVVGDDVRFEQGDASGYVAADPVDVAACLGATWIGDGVLGRSTCWVDRCVEAG